MPGQQSLWPAQAGQTLGSVEGISRADFRDPRPGACEPASSNAYAVRHGMDATACYDLLSVTNVILEETLNGLRANAIVHGP
jgi:hypothetical protein